MADQSKFKEALEYGKSQLGLDPSLILKEKQVAALQAAFEGHDVIAVLPTGYGKSLIFQLLPWILQRRWGSPSPVITFVVTPLNSIMQDQVSSLVQKGIAACFLNIEGTGGTTYEVLSGETKTQPENESDDEDDDAEKETSVYTEKHVSLSALRKGAYILIYAHPETLVSNGHMGKILRSEVYQRMTGCIAVDEVHMVSEWGEEFRTAFMKLTDLNSLFSDAVHLAVTATLTPSAISKMKETLQLDNPVTIQLNPDRPNIFLEIKSRLPNIAKLDKYDDLISPLCEELRTKKAEFPLTIVYVDNLDALGYYYQFLEHNLGLHGYLSDKPAVPENRLFGMYHKDYTPRMKSLIISELRKKNPVLRLVLATVALGMGLDAPSVTRIIHFRPPTNLEKYFQEIGRAGRQGQPAVSTMFFNNSDIATNRPGFSKEMAEFCRNMTTCLRKHLLQYFGFETLVFNGPAVDCCTNCRKVSDSGA